MQMKVMQTIALYGEDTSNNHKNTKLCLINNDKSMTFEENGELDMANNFNISFGFMNWVYVC